MRLATEPAGDWPRRAILVVLATLTVLAVAMHVPGHLSMDSSMQIYEAKVGHSVSWFPRFMSAFLRWLGGGGQATSLFVMTCAIATYGGFALVLRAAGAPNSEVHLVIRTATWLAILLLVINPIIFLHVGIVWKDVLFAALLALAVGLMLLATSARGNSARLLFLLAGIALLPTPLVRQQGLIVAPILLIPCILGVTGAAINARLHRGHLFTNLLGVSLLYATLFGLTYLAVDRTISDSPDRSSSVGITAIQRYDITGMLAAGAATDALPGSLRTSSFLAAVRQTYSAARLDHVLAEPSVSKGFQSLDTQQLQSTWAGMIHNEPLKYATVKTEQYAWLIGLHRLDRCLPIHIGVEGNREYLAAVGIPPGTDDRDRALYQVSVWSRQLPIYRHWFYVLIFLACAGALVIGRRRFDSVQRLTLAAIIVAISALYGSFLPTVLACDFRYLYPGIVLVSLLTAYTLAAFISRQKKDVV